ncbi:hypothetical protein N9J72_01565 [Candidatus Gracilibacteria bacterium]|nr:hypothetical protein [Candidatus Gracilibacteria bacterium]
MLFRIEIFCFFLSFGYILYFFADKIFLIFRARRLKNLEKVSRLEARREKQKESKLTNAQKLVTQKIKQEKPVKSDHKQSEKIRNIIQRAEVNISRGYLESARVLIVEGLTMKKDDKDLNITLADIYEREKKYQNAEYIYKDMLEIHEQDEELLRKLGYVLALQGKNEESFHLYEQAFEKNGSNQEVLDTLSHLGLELKNYKKALKYSNLFLKQKPRDSDKLGIKGYCLEVLGDADEAIIAYRKLLEVQPYNSEVQDRITQLSS